MPIYSRHQLSGSDHGLPIFVTATAEAGAQTIHVVQATATNVLELVSLWGMRNATTAADFLRANIVQTNSATNVDVVFNLISQATGVAHNVGGLQLLSAQPFTGTDTLLSAFATSTTGFLVWGHVDRIATG